MQSITVAAAIILNANHELLLVRKHNTRYFMQAGGKLEPDEAPEQTILREIQEELSSDAHIESFIGRFETQAANEENCQLISYVYQVSLVSEPIISQEIAEMKWISLNDTHTALAPLTKQVVIPWCQSALDSLKD